VRRLVVLLSAALLTALPAAAQVTNYPNLLPQNWSAEPKGMDHESLGLILPCGINRIAANMRLSNPTKLRAVLPLVDMTFSIPNEAVLLRLGANGNGGAELVMRKSGGARAGQDIRFAVPVAYGKDVPVVVRWHPNGRIDVTAGGRTHNMTMSKPPADVEFVANGGKGEITNLRAGWEGGGQATACAKPLR
jgi:hypothetical protein